MLHSVALPKYKAVKDFDGNKDFAVGKYYRFPFSLFYCQKLKMIVRLLERGKIYRNILDFGSGKAEIFREELEKHALNVKCVDIQDSLDLRWKFDVVVCASVLEFVNLPVALSILRNVTNVNGMIVGASPMDTWATRLYFKLIGDKNSRNTHKVILNELSRYFFIVEKSEWFGLYFSFKGYPKK